MMILKGNDDKLTLKKKKKTQDSRDLSSKRHDPIFYNQLKEFMKLRSAYILLFKYQITF